MILIVAAVPQETALVRRRLEQTRTTRSGHIRLINGQLQGLRVGIAHSGLGVVNMAALMTAVLPRSRPEQVFLIGCGGGYPESGLEIGDLAVAESETYGDLGVLTPEGFLHAADLENRTTDKSSFNVQKKYFFNKEKLKEIKAEFPHVRSGPFVTVSCCSGTAESSLRLQQRTGGICENMEGAAAAQLCAEFAVPMLELRGISNPTGTRDPELWNIEKGVGAAQQGLLQLLEKQTLKDKS